MMTAAAVNLIHHEDYSPRPVYHEEMCEKLIQLSFAKIVHSKSERGGARLHKNLLILHLLQRARLEQRTRIMAATSMALVNGQCARQEECALAAAVAAACVPEEAKSTPENGPVGGEQEAEMETGGGLVSSTCLRRDGQPTLHEDAATSAGGSRRIDCADDCQSQSDADARQPQQQPHGGRRHDQRQKLEVEDDWSSPHQLVINAEPSTAAADVQRRTVRRRPGSMTEQRLPEQSQQEQRQATACDEPQRKDECPELRRPSGCVAEADDEDCKRQTLPAPPRRAALKRKNDDMDCWGGKVVCLEQHPSEQVSGIISVFKSAALHDARDDEEAENDAGDNYEVVHSESPHPRGMSCTKFVELACES